MYRIMVVRMPKAIGNTVTDYQNVYPFETVNQGAVGNTMILPLDKDRGIKTYYDRTFNLNTGFSAIGSGGKESHMKKSLWIRRKASRPVVYNQGIAQIVNSPLLLYVIPYDSFGTLFTDNIASFAMHYRLYYKDM